MQGVKTVFSCTPQSPNPTELDSYYRSFVEPFATAAKAMGVTRVVSVSGGDDLPDPKGPGAVLRMTEMVLDAAIPNARHIRCGYFMENLLWQTEPLTFQGIFYLPVAANIKLPFVATADIGRAASNLLDDDTWNGIEAVEAYGPESLSCADAAVRLSDALKTSIRFQSAEPERWITEIIGHGLSPAMANSLRDMFDTISDGRDMGSAPKKPLKCPTHLGDWARDKLLPAILNLRAK